MNILENMRKNKLLLIAMLKLILERCAENGIQLEININKLCQDAGVNRTHMYEKKKPIEKVLTAVELPGPGHPVQKIDHEKECICQKLTEKVLRYRLAHPGALVEHESRQANYSNGFKRPCR